MNCGGFAKRRLGALRRRAGINPAPTHPQEQEKRARRRSSKSRRTWLRRPSSTLHKRGRDSGSRAGRSKQRPYEGTSPTLTKRAWGTRKGQTLKQRENAWLRRARPDHSRALQRQERTGSSPHESRGFGMTNAGCVRKRQRAEAKTPPFANNAPFLRQGKQDGAPAKGRRTGCSVF